VLIPANNRQPSQWGYWNRKQWFQACEGLANQVPWKRFGISVILFYTFTITILRAVRLPNDYAEALWVLDYRFGFVKRGLVGSVLSLLDYCLHIRPTEHVIVLLSGVIFFVFCTVVIGLGFRIVHRSRWSVGSVLVVAVFFSSPFMVISAHLMGYFDSLVIVLAVISMICLSKGKIWSAACLQGTAILIHESSLLIGFPVFCLAWLLLNCRRIESSQAPLSFTPLLLPIATFLILAGSQYLFLAEDFEQSLTNYYSDFQFIQENRDTLVPTWLTTTFFEFFVTQKGAFFQRLSAPSMFNLVLPSMLAILCFIFHACSIRETSMEPMVILGVCLIPQIMHLVAWDTTRIYTYSILNSFLVLWYYTELFRQTEESSPVVRFLCFAILVWNIVQETPLMDNESDHLTLDLRLLLFTPVFLTVLLLVLHKEPIPLKCWFVIRGRALRQLVCQPERCFNNQGTSTPPSSQPSNDTDGEMFRSLPHEP